MGISKNFIFKILFISSLAVPVAACNSNDSERFNEQKESYLFDTTSTVLTAFGASKIETSESSNFRCPSVSGMSSESSLTVFYARANAPEPHFTLQSIAGIRSDAPGGVGISLSEIPYGKLDIYERCNATSFEKYTTSCPADYAIVSECQSGSSEKECTLVSEGTHQIVISSVVDSDSSCFTEETDRSPYSSQSTPAVAYACDAFSPVPLLAAYRGNSPTDECCGISERSSIDFCLKPCGCREILVQIVPKEEIVKDAPSQKDGSSSFSNDLKIGVFSNVEGHSDAFKTMLNDMVTEGVDVAISLGNLTESGLASHFSSMNDIIRENLVVQDGSTSPTCERLGEDICCVNELDRQHPDTCNTILTKTSFLASLGEDEFEGSGISTFNELFGPSNVSTFIGKVQLIVLDTADATLGSAERSWLKSVLRTEEKSECRIPAPTKFESWPTLSECRAMLGASDNLNKTVTCRECIAEEAYCIPPDKEREDYTLGPENCICVPKSSKICKNNQSCASMDGTESTCICTRDNDCGDGGACVDGKCKPPLRLIFSYTPLFDESGTRNNAFTSKEEAASLLSLLVKSGVDAVFSGRIRDYGKFSMGGVPMYITGGGGAAMSSFSKHGKHWLLIDIPNAYTVPNADEMTVSVMDF